MDGEKRDIEVVFNDEQMEIFSKKIADAFLARLIEENIKLRVAYTKALQSLQEDILNKGTSIKLLCQRHVMKGKCSIIDKTTYYCNDCTVVNYCTEENKKWSK